MPKRIWVEGTKAVITHTLVRNCDDAQFGVDEFWYEDNHSRFHCHICNITWDPTWDDTARSCPHIGWLEMRNYTYGGGVGEHAPEKQDGDV